MSKQRATGFGWMVNVPFLNTDENGEPQRNVARMAFRQERGIPELRKVKRMIRRWVKYNLERTLHTGELNAIMKNCQVLDARGHVYDRQWFLRNKRFLK